MLDATAAPHSKHGPVPPPPQPQLTMLHVFPPCAMVVTGLIGCTQRRRLREAYGIGGSPISDFICHCCCHCCSLAKEAREISTQQVKMHIISADIVDEEEL